MKPQGNGWHLYARGYMTSEPLYQRVLPKHACDAIDHGTVVTFVRVDNGRDVERRNYVPIEDFDKLRELVRDMYDNYRVGWNEEIEDDLWNRMRELGIEMSDE